MGFGKATRTCPFQRKGKRAAHFHRLVVRKDHPAERRRNGPRKPYEGDIEDILVRFERKGERSFEHFPRNVGADVYFGNHRLTKV